jgi:beta-lactamase class A
MISRRMLVTGLTAAAAYSVASRWRPALAGPDQAQALARAFAGIEARVGGRLGVAVLDTGSGLTAARRGDERFPLCSTFKWLAGAAILARVDAGDESLDRTVPIRAEDIVTYSPETEKHAGESMELGAICAAAITLSDNTAGNLMLDALGGPEALTAYARSLGDAATRLDRNEAALNEAAPGDPRDTTMPLAMATNLEKVLTGDALTKASRDQLTAWLVANTTGDARLRAGLPEGWRVGDKTGTCNAHTANDVGIVWPPNGAPILIAVYLAETNATGEERNATIADVARAVAKVIG